MEDAEHWGCSSLLMMFWWYSLGTSSTQSQGMTTERDQNEQRSVATGGQVLHTLWCHVRISITDCKQPLKTSWKAFGKSRSYIIPNYHPWQTSLSTGLLTCSLVFHVLGGNGGLGNLLMKVNSLNRITGMTNSFSSVEISRKYLSRVLLTCYFFPVF